MTRLQDAHAEVAFALGRLNRLFAKGCKLTFVMRAPDNDQAYVVVTEDDDLDEVIATIERSKSRERVTPQ